MSTIQFEAAPLPVHTNQELPDGPRKKRKRAPAQGAADDCFTCSSRKIKCDRRRPYCSQCLDGGQDCAGYKTQLTWGVGVASRGKLRGLSLPVAGTSKTASDETTSSSKSKKRTASSKEGSKTSTPPSRSGLSALASSPPTKSEGTTFTVSISKASPSSDVTSRDAHAMRPLATRGSLPRQIPSHGNVSASGPSFSVNGTVYDNSPTNSTLSSNPNFSPPYDKPRNMQAPPYPTPSPTGQYFQPYPHSQQQRQLPLTPTSHSYHTITEPHTLSHHTYHQVRQEFVPTYTDLPTFNDRRSYIDCSIYPPPSGGLAPSLSGTILSTSEEDIEEINRDYGNDGVFSDTLSISSSSLPMDHGFSFPLSGVSVVGKTPRMQYLIQYYAEVIAPVCVAFDSATNPLRNQILGLAARSESLQHAISALSASNIRQRRESGALSTGKTPGARRSSYMHLSLMNGSWDEPEILTTQEQRREESLHKYAAVKHLNQQLANVHLRKDDSVLATLLMLCLFHVCDSGIARFQTQFEGVKKLLTLRGNNFDGPNGNTKWMNRIFTIFDSVAATVNDREIQLDGQNTDTSTYVDGEWHYEMLSGIDSRLVRAMSRLGRLNVLSQGKCVESNPTIVSRPFPNIPFTKGVAHHNFETFDGNGWMRLMSDENLFNIKTATATVQEQFWREWREVRQELQGWSMDNTRFNGSDRSQPYLTDEQRFDLLNISESFRYSSLLYTERLADPGIQSSNPKIQCWVQKALYHIKLVRADVYLLWPLFITGSECGEEHERNVIRERCLDIQKDSGFMNNSTCLALLEKIWNGSDHVDSDLGVQTRKKSNFRFRDVMLAEGNEGEWIVV